MNVIHCIHVSFIASQKILEVSTVMSFTVFFISKEKVQCVASASYGI